MSTDNKRGKLIVFEGLDGSGKTSLSALVCQKLNSMGIPCREEREPSDSPPGTLARKTVQQTLHLEPQSLALLFAADRYEHIVGVLLPLLEQGIHVLCDRFLFSNMAYQGLQLPMEDIWQYNHRGIQLLEPDLTLFIDTPPEICVSRMNRSRTDRELFDAEGSRIRRSYLAAFDWASKTHRLEFINGNDSLDGVFHEIWSILQTLLPELM